MEMDTMLFQAPIINADRYRKLKPYRYTLYFVLIFLAGLYIKPRTIFQGYPSLLERLGISFELYFFIVILAIGLTIALYLYSKKNEEIGTLVIRNSGIEIHTNERPIFYPYSELKDLMIRRGATFHYAYKKDNYLVKTNNWISFCKSVSSSKYEFLIDSLEQNQKFEAMIQTLVKQRIKLQYRTI